MSAVVPETPPPPPPSPGASFDFLKPFTFAFDDPRWVPKILIGGAFVFASFFIIGAFFVYGYLARLVRNVINGVQHPLPEWDDLGEYFTEGLKLFVVALIYTIPIVILAGIVFVPAIIASGSTDSETIRSVAGMSASCVWCMIFPLGLALALWMPAALMMVVVTGEFSAGFDFGRILGFIRANVGNYLLAFVAWMVARFAASLGFLLLCVGIIFTMFWAFIVAGYAFGQVYRLSKVR